MKKVILEEIENMRYLFGYKRGVVISEQQQTTYGNEYITGADPVNTAQIPSLGGIQPSNQSTADMLKNAQAVAAGITTTNNQSQQATGTQATGTQATGTQATGTQATGTQATGTQATGTQATGTQATGTQATGTQATGTQATGTQATGTQATGTQATGTQSTTAPVTPIKIGVKYPDIEKLQISLNTKNQAGLKEDGKYGPLTAASVLAALQKLPVNSTETKTTNSTTSNTTDQNAETLKKTAEANASTNVVKTNDQNKDTKQPVGGTNVPEGDGNEYI
jgi:hypothetical protein